LLQAADIATATPRLTALALGGEDFSADCGFQPTAETLALPCQQLVLAARAAGVEAIGLPGSIAEIDDMDKFACSVRKARACGLDGVLCVHPQQVEAVNAVFAPTSEELARAERMVSAFEAAQREGTGAILLDGKMIDPPVVERARAMLRHNPRQKSCA
jgi:citrate lyase subunit beta/citryl-CoA lyase